MGSTQDKNKTQKQEDKEQQEQELALAQLTHKPHVVQINPDTGLGGYDFGDGFGLSAGVKQPMTEDEYNRYRGVAHNGRKVLVKA